MGVIVAALFTFNPPTADMCTFNLHPAAFICAVAAECVGCRACDRFAGFFAGKCCRVQSVYDLQYGWLGGRAPGAFNAVKLAPLFNAVKFRAGVPWAASVVFGGSSAGKRSPLFRRSGLHVGYDFAGVAMADDRTFNARGLWSCRWLRSRMKALSIESWAGVWAGFRRCICGHGVGLIIFPRQCASAVGRDRSAPSLSPGCSARSICAPVVGV